MQYPSIDLYSDDLTWMRFATLLSGLSSSTPLGQVVMIRSETDPERIRAFSSQERTIYDSWQKRTAKTKIKQEAKREGNIASIQAFLASAFGK